MIVSYRHLINQNGRRRKDWGQGSRGMGASGALGLGDPGVSGEWMLLSNRCLDGPAELSGGTAGKEKVLPSSGMKEVVKGLLGGCEDLPRAGAEYVGSLDIPGAECSLLKVNGGDVNNVSKSTDSCALRVGKAEIAGESGPGDSGEPIAVCGRCCIDSRLKSLDDFPWLVFEGSGVMGCARSIEGGSGT